MLHHIRVTRKYAWLPMQVWKYKETIGDTKLGTWVRIWLKEYWIVEKLTAAGWKYYTGDYLEKQHADQLLSTITA